MIARGVIDVHSHVITPEYLDAIKAHHLENDEGFPLPKWDPDSQLAFMDKAGIECMVLTMCAPQPKDGREVIRQVNERCAQLKREHPSRFKFCAAVPLPDVGAAVSEAVYALDVLGADGIKLATNSHGQYLGDPALDTLMQVLNDRHAVVILHPHRPEPYSAAVMRQTPLAMQEYLGETTRAIVNMFARNIPARYPNIKFVVPHCGAFLPLAIPRMKSLHPVMKANGKVGEIDWEKNLSSLYYDLAGSHSPEVIKMMLSITTPDHIMYGSDYPYVASTVLCAQLERMKRYLAEDPELAPYSDMFLSENARYLFGDRSGKPQPVTVADDGLIVRIAEVEVYPEFLTEYLEYAGEVDRVSVEKEPGVICLFPMQSAENANHIRILEIYASEEAYQQHLKTAHFQKYKQGTLLMVKSLNLAPMQPLDEETMKLLFMKIKR